MDREPAAERLAEAASDVEAEPRAAALPLGRSELADEVLVDLAEQVDVTVVFLEDLLREQVDEAAKVLRVERGSTREHSIRLNSPVPTPRGGA